MYVTTRDVPHGDERPASATSNGVSPRRRRVATTVILMGIVSLLTDISSESVSAVLPLYLTTFLGMSALAYGLVDGIYQGVSALVRILGGWIADRTDHPKWIAAAGYALSAFSRLILLPASTFSGITTSITMDRLGKGLRTAPRDAVIAAASPQDQLGRAFGVHRTLDTVGALIGPLLAFFILLHVADDFHTVFVTSLAFAVIGLAVLVLLVRDIRPRREAAADHADANRAADAGSLDEPEPESEPEPDERDSDDPELDDPPPATRPSLRRLANPQVARLVAAASLLGLLTIGDGFLYLELQHRDDMATKYFPLLYVGTNFAYLALAIPFGRLADRIGRIRVFLGGNVLLLIAYLVAGGPVTGAWMTVACLLLLGAYYAATDGVLSAIAGRLTDTSVRASAIATAQTSVAVARFASSLLFGLAWVKIGSLNALWLFTGLLALGLPMAALLLRGVPRAAAARLAVSS